MEHFIIMFYVFSEMCWLIMSKENKTPPFRAELSKQLETTI